MYRVQFMIDNLAYGQVERSSIWKVDRDHPEEAIGDGLARCLQVFIEHAAQSHRTFSQCTVAFRIEPPTDTHHLIAGLQKLIRELGQVIEVTPEPADKKPKK